MKKLFVKFFSLRVFWYKWSVQMGDGYIYACWRNWVFGENYYVFQAYGWEHGQRKDSSTFIDARAQILALHAEEKI